MVRIILISVTATLLAAAAAAWPRADNVLRLSTHFAYGYDEYTYVASYGTARDSGLGAGFRAELELPWATFASGLSFLDLERDLHTTKATALDWRNEFYLYFRRGLLRPYVAGSGGLRFGEEDTKRGSGRGGGHVGLRVGNAPSYVSLDGGVGGAPYLVFIIRARINVRIIKFLGLNAALEMDAGVADRLSNARATVGPSFSF